MNKEHKRYQLASRVTKLSDVNNRYIELEMFVSDTDSNLNGVVTTKKFLEKRYSTLETMPLQVDRAMLESGFTNSLTHKWDGESLNTDSIGAFTEVWLQYKEDDNEYVAMYAKSRIWKRYKSTVDAVKQLYEEDNLRFSWELLAYEVEEKEDGLAYIEDGEFEAHAIVSQPAYGERAKATQLVASRLVAEAYNKDLDDINLSDVSNIDNKRDVEELTLSEDGVENEKEHVEKEGGESMKNYLAEILKEKSMDEARHEIAKAIRATLDLNEQGAYVYDMYQTQVVAEIYSKETYVGEYYRVPFTVAENKVSVDMESKKEVVDVWMDKSDLDSVDNPMISEGDGRKVSELKDAKSTLETKISELEGKIELLSQVPEVVIPEVEVVGEPVVAEENIGDKVIKETNEKDVELAEKVIALSETVERLESEVEILKPYKEKLEAEEAEKVIAEETATKTRLSELVKKFTKEDEIPEEVETFISEMDEKSIKLWIAETVIKVEDEGSGDDDSEKDIVVETPSENSLVKEQDEEIEMY